MAQRKLSVGLAEDVAAAPVGRAAPAAVTDAAISQNSQFSIRTPTLWGVGVVLWGELHKRASPHFFISFNLRRLPYHVSGALYIVPCSQGSRGDGTQCSVLRREREQHRYYGAPADLALNIYAALVLTNNGVAGV
jgi:hypothetical protein